MTCENGFQHTASIWFQVKTWKLEHVWIESLNLIFSNLFFRGWHMGFYIRKKNIYIWCIVCPIHNQPSGSFNPSLSTFPNQIHLHTLDGKKPQQKLHPHLVRAFLGIGVIAGSVRSEGHGSVGHCGTCWSVEGFGRKPFFEPKTGRFSVHVLRETQRWTTWLTFCWEAMF